MGRFKVGYLSGGFDRVFHGSSRGERSFRRSHLRHREEDFSAPGGVRGGAIEGVADRSRQTFRFELVVIRAHSRHPGKCRDRDDIRGL